MSRDAIDDLVDWQLGIGPEVLERECRNCGTWWTVPTLVCPLCLMQARA